MPIELLVKNATGLPDRYVDMAVSYIHYLEAQYQQEQRNAAVIQKRSLGILSDKFHYISDDFDQTPDCFKEYM
ncbi:MAG: DUF2281 domain-containing protein [Clostridia bacterium]|nr:DUF2281 domain-containing protein [Clostridia bacterium]